jgi:acyl-ACP thioesterase
MSTIENTRKVCKYCDDCIDPMHSDEQASRSLDRLVMLYPPKQKYDDETLNRIVYEIDVIRRDYAKRNPQ